MKHELHMPAAVLALAVRRGDQTLYTACLDGGIYEIRLQDGSRERLAQHASYASGVVVAERMSQLISAGYDGVLKWYDLEQRKSLREVKAHDFWSWQLAIAGDETRVASATGQYLCGGYKYEPARETEPSVKIFDAASGEQLHALEHLPPVESVTFSPDNKYVAAGNLMGDVRVWDSASGKLVSSWRTPSFTGWGIIKGHYYTGGIFSLAFDPYGGDDLFLAGMGKTRDPAAGNGRQLWQRFRWRESRKVDETHDGESGRGLMETLTFHPSGEYFVMAGRIAKGNWNVAFFSAETGGILRSLNTKTRVTRAAFSSDGRDLYLAGAVSQGKQKEGKFREFGRVGHYELPLPERSF